MPREPRASADVVDQTHARFDTEIPNLEAMIQRGFAAGNLRRVAPMAAKLLLRSTEQIRVSYAVGSPVEDIAPLVRTAGDRWSQVFEQAGEAATDPALARYLGPELLRTEAGYAAVVDLLAWATALGEQATVSQVAATPVVNGSSDIVVDTLLVLGGEQREVASTATFDTLYSGWVSLAHAPVESRAAALASYVSSWEQAWIDTGTMERPGSPQYIGNWCFDVVPLVVAHDIDDNAVRDQPVYPADLVDAARGRR